MFIKLSSSWWSRAVYNFRPNLMTLDSRPPDNNTATQYMYPHDMYRCVAFVLVHVCTMLCDAIRPQKPPDQFYDFHYKIPHSRTCYSIISLSCIFGICGNLFFLQPQKKSAISTCHPSFQIYFLCVYFLKFSSNLFDFGNHNLSACIFCV